MNLNVVRSLTVFFSFLFIVPAYSQSSNPTYQIKGAVVDSASGKALEYVTVALKSADNKPVKTALTSTKGTFSFANLQKGTYKLNIISVGYRGISKEVSLDGSSTSYDAGSLRLAAQQNQLNEVSITADRPLVKQEIDRIAYDVQADPENKVNNVLDMLRKMPLVSIDADDNIQVKGSGSFKVLINGRPSSMVARSPKDVFKSMPASNIQKIEVITTPPAKYDGEGIAGIINIITNKKVDKGYNASVSTSYNAPYGPGLNGQITAKGEKFGVSSYSGGNWRNTPNTNFSLLRTSLSANATPTGSLITSGERENRNSYRYSNAELSYEIDTLNLITAELGYNGGNGNNNSLQRIEESAGTGARGYRIDNTSGYDWRGYELGLNYQLGFKRNKEQLLTGSYKFNSEKEESISDFFSTNYYGYQPSEKTPNNGRNNTSGAKEQTIQLDYLHPVKKVNAEAGLKLILRNNFSDYEYGIYNDENDFVVNEAMSNNFDYRQNVYSFYNSYQLKLKDWGVKAGLRLERTLVDADFVSSKSFFKTDYNNLIPSVSLQRKFKNNSSINLGYTQRIQRPSIWQLNPFEAQFNENFTQRGNTQLKPVLNHSFELSYSIFKKASINSGLSYSFANNTIQYVNRLDGKVSRATFENIGENKDFGFNLSTNQQIKSFNFNVNGRLSYVFMEGVIDGALLKNDGMQGNIYGYAGYKFKNDWRAGLNGGFYSAWITLQGQSNPYYYTSASLSKELLNKKLTLSGSVSNPFQKFRTWRNETYGTLFTQSELFQNYYRSFKFSVNYKFGQLKDQIKKGKRGINNDDVSGGKGGGN
ncbi:outer membrane beta-barrel protein [Pedobacter sp. SYSU D00535]|uniref:outer membrane beta-barrel protein n=1 Tax=Pedobacter sp. SYSU D00535 TaxID=2810308 RepID=UPI001A96DB7F|nr:outer membrane beta-barrel protein [Pedobacter sp. SYSU D00535]